MEARPQCPTLQTPVESQCQRDANTSRSPFRIFHKILQKEDETDLKLYFFSSFLSFVEYYTNLWYHYFLIIEFSEIVSWEDTFLLRLISIYVSNVSLYMYIYEMFVLGNYDFFLGTMFFTLEVVPEQDFHTI